MIKKIRKALSRVSQVSSGLKNRVTRKKKKKEPLLPSSHSVNLNTNHHSNTNFDRTKVLMFGWELPPFNSGGLGVACYDMAEALTRQNAEVTFVLPRKQNLTTDFMKVEFAEEFDEEYREHLNKKTNSLSIKEIDTLLSPYIDEKTYNEKYKKYYSSAVFGIWRSFVEKFGHPVYSNDLIGEVHRYGEAAARIAKKEKFDVIHAHDWLAYPAGVRAKMISKKPLIVHVHAMEYDRSQEDSVDPRICAIEKMGLDKADKIIAISNYVKNRIIHYYHIPAKKIEVVHNGITLPKMSKAKNSLKTLKDGGKKMVLFVGRITYQKGVDYLINAAAKVIKKNPKAIFMIVGSGDMKNQVINQTANLGISDKVFFPGFLRNSELANIYQSADLFVMPSVSEPFGLVVMEAMGYKVPVILSHQSGAAEVINHGLKVNFWDTDELANKILSVLNYPSLRKSLSEYGYGDAVRCSWDSAAEKCLRIYNSLATV